MWVRDVREARSTTLADDVKTLRDMPGGEEVGDHGRHSLHSKCYVCFAGKSVPD